MKIFKKNYIIGLDIGSSSVKIARFVKREDGLHLLGADLKEIAFVEDEALREKEILTALKSLLKGVEISKSKFMVSIDCPQTAIKKITMPYMPIGELRDSLMLGAKNHFPFSITQAQVDFEILGDIVEKGVKKYQILVATSPKKTIDRYLSMLSKVNIKPASFIPSSLALQRTVENFSFPQTDTAKAVLEIGELLLKL
jgi:type IV pilus assembly protein PilM